MGFYLKQKLMREFFFKSAFYVPMQRTDELSYDE